VQHQGFAGRERPGDFGHRSLTLARIELVVANRSDADLRVWRECCSWGWFLARIERQVMPGDLLPEGTGTVNYV
jgi:hypothetical protein